MHRTALQPQRCRCGSVPHDPLPAAIPSRRADLRRWRAQPSRSASRCQLRAMPDVGAAIDSLVTSGAPAPLREAVQEFQAFEPQMNPWVAVAALAAALPPVVFWGRIFWNARARVKEDERKELEREALRKKLFGGR